MQTARVLGACLVGADAELVTVEGRYEPGDKGRLEVLISGLPDPVIRESRSRLLCALEACGLRLGGGGRVFLNLVPAGRRKSGEMLDLPLVLSAAAALGHLDAAAFEGVLFLGELGIDGRLHAVPGGLAAAALAHSLKLPRLVAPGATASEAACQSGVEVLQAGELSEVLAWCAGRHPALRAAQAQVQGAAQPSAGRALARVRGQHAGKRALALAAAGGHGLLLVGPPGTGKSLLAQALAELLSRPSEAECLEITRVLSVAGRWPGGLAQARPFRAPHHTISYAGLVGGGSPPQPGEISLAHGGALFLDELPEFRREVLEALRQPLESGRILISRAGRQLELPARFQLVCAMNPCPCGYLGHPRIACKCSPLDVRRYRQRISGPLLDRIELRLELNAPSVEDLLPPGPGADRPEEADLAQAVEQARQRMRARQAERCNAVLEAEELDRVAPLTPALQLLVERAVARRGLSARAVQSLRRVARTIADFADAATPSSAHLAEALALRAELL